MSELLVLDVGTTGLRASLVDAQGEIRRVAYRRQPPQRSAAGVAEFDPRRVAETALELATEVLAESGPCAGVAIANQRASTVLWDAASGDVLGPGLGWQDLRTAGQCLALRAAGLRLTPSQSATKLAYLVQMARNLPESARFGTLDTWIAWHLSGGSLHVTDATNAAVTGLLLADASGWDEAALHALGLAPSLLARIVDSTALVGEASALPGAPPIVALVGDQQASLIGQGCVEPGRAKATFGTGAMLDLCLGATRPAFGARGEGGTFPIVAWREHGSDCWGLEAILLAAGSCVDWLRDGLGLIASVEESESVAASVRDAGGVSFVPAFGGLATPEWDFGARGALLGLDHSSGRAEIVYAVLEGIALAGADLLVAAEHDADLEVSELRVDGGMSSNGLFLQLLADATGKVVQASSVTEATTLGAAFLGHVALGNYRSLQDSARFAHSRVEVEPKRRLDHERWHEARERALGAVPFLTSLEF
jgi:glycerol kinase